jgi:hypothetical protein
MRTQAMLAGAGFEPATLYDYGYGFRNTKWIQLAENQYRLIFFTEQFLLRDAPRFPYARLDVPTPGPSEAVHQFLAAPYQNNFV